MKILKNETRDKSDISFHDSSLEELKQYQAFLRASLDSQKDILIFATDPKYRYLFFNEAHKQAMKLSYNVDIAIGMNILDCMTSKSDRLRAKYHGDRVLKGEAHSDTEEYGDVKRSYYEFFYNPIMDENKHIIGATVFGRDVTARKNMEEELLRQKDFFEQIFTQSSISIEILDKDGWCERINPKLSQIFGVKKEVMEGKKYNIFKDKEIIRTGVVSQFKKVFEEGQTAEWEVYFDIGIASDSQKIPVSEKKKVWYYTWAFPIFDKDKKLTNVVVQHSDITDRKTVEESLKNKIRELEQINKHMIDRELKMIELKNRIKELEKQLKER